LREKKARIVRDGVQYAYKAIRRESGPRESANYGLITEIETCVVCIQSDKERVRAQVE
jgi:hypothetical protein